MRRKGAGPVEAQATIITPSPPGVVRRGVAGDHRRRCGHRRVFVDSSKQKLDRLPLRSVPSSVVGREPPSTQQQTLNDNSWSTVARSSNQRLFSPSLRSRQLLIASK